VKFCKPKIFTAIWFFALFLNALSAALLAAPPSNPAETVYCPLTRKLQPVKATKKEVRQNPLAEICADERDKKSFADELFRQNRLKTNFADEKHFEDLVFDFFQKGKSAFAGLPQFPDSPQKDSVKVSYVALSFGKISETKVVWKSPTENLSFAQNPRPPNPVSANFFESQNSPSLEIISRRIAPRAPPVSL
jgi:hypothetical protein